MAFSAAESEAWIPCSQALAAHSAQRFLFGPDIPRMLRARHVMVRVVCRLTGATCALCRGKYADVPYISESVYLQVDASL